jgi:hypothetical protein
MTERRVSERHQPPGGSSFRLAPMSPLIRWLTVAMFALPGGFLLAGALGNVELLVGGVLLVALYGWIWLRFRPSRFVVLPDAIEVVWPLKRRRIPRRRIAGVRLMDSRELRGEVGWGMRVGAGGLWGGFGWLWTGRRGIVQMYVSRTDRFVWIEVVDGRPWLITPERAETFLVRAR